MTSDTVAAVAAPKLRRRVLIAGGCVALGLGIGVPLRRYQTRPALSGAILTPVEAHARALSGEITLIDIRRPDEWAATGVGEGAHPLDMRSEDFAARLTRLAGGRNQPVAVICARGVRSRRLAETLRQAGFSDILDVPEGMSGSRAGPGWVGRGLPVTPFRPE